MKKKFFHSLTLIFSLILLSSVLYGCGGKTNNGLKKIKLNEVARSVFYAPMYAAISEGMFKEEGLQIDLSTGEGADKTMQQVLSGSDDIGFCGPEQIIYIYNQKKENYPVLFAQLTQTEGSFMVGRKPEPNFKWENLKGKTIVGGRPGGVPEMALEYALKKYNLKAGQNVTVLTNIAYTATGGAFKGGTGDYVALFEPTGSMMEKEKSGYIVASVGESVGRMPETCYFATKSYIEKNPDIIQKFTNAIYKGQLWVSKHSDEEVAKSIKSFFPGSDEDILTSVVKNYRKINAFAPSPTLKSQDLDTLMNIIESYDPKLIPQRPPYENIVTTKFSDKAINDIK